MLNALTCVRACMCSLRCSARKSSWRSALCSPWPWFSFDFACVLMCTVQATIVMIALCCYRDRKGEDITDTVKISIAFVTFNGSACVLSCVSMHSHTCTCSQRPSRRPASHRHHALAKRSVTRAPLPHLPEAAGGRCRVRLCDVCRVAHRSIGFCAAEFPTASATRSRPGSKLVAPYLPVSLAKLSRKPLVYIWTSNCIIISMCVDLDAAAS